MTSAYCRSCRATTTWYGSGSFNGSHPLVTAHRCRRCGFERVQMADVPDSDGLCYATIDAWLRTTGNQRTNIDFEDALGTLRECLWVAYRRWDPTLGVPFLAYGTAMVRHRILRWSHDNLTGRPGGKPKAHVGAISLSAIADGDDEWDPLDATFGSWEGDPAEGCSPDLGGVLARRSRSDAREERKLGIGADARAAEGDSAAAV